MSASGIDYTVKRACEIAISLRHEFVTLEHLLASLLEIEGIKTLITEVKGDLKKLSTDLADFLNDDSKHSVMSTVYSPRITEKFATVLKKAKTQSMFSGRDDVGDLDLFIALFGIQDCHASYFLQTSQITKEAIVKHLQTKYATQDANLAKKDAEAILEQYCVNLNEKAKLGKIDPLIGREKEVLGITLVMARRTKNNVIMLGDPGVGKTQIVEGLAKKISEGAVPDTLKDKIIWSLDVASIVAGTKFRGDFEDRMKQIIQAFSTLDTAIMFVDEIHMIMGAGGGGQGAMDAANLLKPALGRGEIHCIGSTTLEEYRKHFEKDRALNRRFQKIHINEPSIIDAKRILAAISPYYSKFHGVTYTAEAIDAAVELSVRYMHGKFLPDKAIDIIDAAGARQRIKPVEDRASEITLEEIKFEVSEITQVPIEVEKASEKTKLQKLEPDLKGSVFGQDTALIELVDAVLVSRSGLRESNKTLGSFLFTGPTGVGKTETAAQLAKTLGIPLVRFNMSEFQEEHTVSRFIGSPPGYVGYNDGSSGSGELINTLEKTPHCVLLCDEIEKAHQKISNIFLQIMDNGEVSSQNGKTVSAENVFLIFTSNLGAAIMEKQTIGFGNPERTDDDVVAVKEWFAPEFRNRLDSVIRFNRLSKENMGMVLDKFLRNLDALTMQKNVKLIFDQSAKNWLIEKGFDRLMGARPLNRVIHKHVKTPLSREMAFGKLVDGGTAMFSVENDRLEYTILDSVLPVQSNTTEGVNA